MGEISGPFAWNATFESHLFSSSSPLLDKWLQQTAAKAEAAKTARVFVMLDQDRIIGYYALTSSSLLLSDLPKSQRRNLPKHPVPCILISRLAVDSEYQGLGVGGVMIRDAIEKSLLVRESAGTVALIAHAKDEKAKGFYLAMGFQPSPITENLVSLHLAS